MSPSRIPRSQITQTTVSFIAPGYGGQQDSQKHYAERLSETGESLSRVLQDIEAAQPAQYQSILSAVLTIPLADLQNGCPTRKEQNSCRRCSVGLSDVLSEL
jgi:hypothetical protein